MRKCLRETACLWQGRNITPEGTVEESSSPPGSLEAERQTDRDADRQADRDTQRQRDIQRDRGRTVIYFPSVRSHIPVQL